MTPGQKAIYLIQFVALIGIVGGGASIFYGFPETEAIIVGISGVFLGFLFFVSSVAVKQTVHGSTAY